MSQAGIEPGTEGIAARGLDQLGRDNAWRAAPLPARMWLHFGLKSMQKTAPTNFKKIHKAGHTCVKFLKLQLGQRFGFSVPDVWLRIHSEIHTKEPPRPFKTKDLGGSLV